jgi:hypothetical protein
MVGKGHHEPRDGVACAEAPRISNLGSQISAFVAIHIPDGSLINSASRPCEYMAMHRQKYLGNKIAMKAFY